MFNIDIVIGIVFITTTTQTYLLTQSLPDTVFKRFASQPPVQYDVPVSV